MTASDLAIWQSDIEDRQRYAETLCLVHLSVNTQSDRATGVFEDDNSGEDHLHD